MSRADYDTQFKRLEFKRVMQVPKSNFKEESLMAIAPNTWKSFLV